MAPRVMTVSGPIPPDKLGFTLPHEHTGIALWHVEKRWDYWELTPDEDLITDELRDFRRRGGGTLVDLTLDGVGRDPHRLRRLASATGLNIVMGAGWYRGAHYPAEALIDRRTVDDLAAEIVARVRPTASATPASGRGSSARSGPTSRGSAPPRSGCTARRRAPRCETGMAITTHGVQSRGRACAAADLHRGGRRPVARRHRPRRLVSRPGLLPRRPRCRCEPPVRLPGASLRRRGDARAAAGRDRSSSCWSAATPRRCCSRRTSATTGSSRRTAASATSTCTSTSCRRCGPRRSGRARSGR